MTYFREKAKPGAATDAELAHIMSDIFSVASSRDGSEQDPFGEDGNAAASSSRSVAGRTPSRKRNAESAQLPESKQADAIDILSHS